MRVSTYIAHLRDHIRHATLLSVAASAIVRDRAGRVLLIHRGGGAGLSSSHSEGWSLPGGSMEPGESIAGRVVREAFEETGLHVEPVRLAGVYSDRAFRCVTHPNGDQVHCVSFSFECRVVGGQARPMGMNRWRWSTSPPTSCQSPSGRVTSFASGMPSPVGTPPSSASNRGCA